MIAVELVQPGEIAIRDMPAPEPGRGEVVVAVETALTCGTDIKTFRRGHPHIPLPAPMGHEASGTVSAVGRDVRDLREGDRIAFVPTVPCGTCSLCRHGRDNLCPHAVGRMNFGAFAEQLRLPAHIVSGGTFLRPDGMSADVAAALEPLACVVRGTRRVRLADTRNVLVLGDGAIALLFVQLIRQHTQARIIVAGHHAARLDVALAFGADTTTLASGDTLRAEVKADGSLADVVIECVGTAAAWDTAASLVGTAGQVLLFGGRAAGERADIDAFRVHYEELNVLGAFHYGRADVRVALEMLADGTVRIAPLVTHRVPLARFKEALDLVLERRAIKVAIEPAASS